MKSTRIFLILLFIAGFFIISPVVLAENISKFETKIAIQKNGEIEIIERIDYDFGDSFRHGIFRNIPYIKTNEEGKKFVMDLKEFSVKNGAEKSYQFTQSSVDSEKQLKIGDKDTTITGKHLYEIKYTVSGALTYFSDHDELYWNVTGNGWEYPIDQVSADIKLPENFSSEKVNLSCFTGVLGSSSKDCTASYASGHVVIRTTKSLSASEGLTVVVGFPKGVVALLEPTLYVPFWDTNGGKALIVILIVVATYWYIILPISIPILWWRNGRDPKSTIGVTSAWFSPPKTKSQRVLSPGETGTLVDEKAEIKDVVCSIVHLAQRGYLKILEPKKNDFHLQKINREAGRDEILQPFEETLLHGLFEKNDLISLKTASLVNVVEKVKNSLYDSVLRERFFDKNPQSTRNLYTILAVFGLITGNIFLIITALLFGLQMPKKTQLGSEVAAVARSLMNFLSSQKRQLEFQAKNQMYFEKLLPYAIAFGVEKIWAKRFADIQMKEPDWYRGYSTGRFNSIIFVNSLSHTTSSFVRAATPVSSSTGHSSGFSGGSSGGGGGGGGGGSW